VDSELFLSRHTSCSKTMRRDQASVALRGGAKANAKTNFRRETIDVLRSNGIVGENPRKLARPDGSPQRGLLDGRQDDRARARSLADLEMVSARDSIRRRSASAAAAASQRDQHCVDAGSRLPGFLHAGWLRHARVGLRELAWEGNHLGRTSPRRVQLARAS